MTQRIIKTILVICLVAVFSCCCIVDTFADQGGMAGGGGDTGTVDWGTITGGGSDKDPCDVNVYNYSSDGPSTIMVEKCTGYSWMFFKAFGPKGGNTSVLVLPKPIWKSDADGDHYSRPSVKNPVIDGSCMKPEYENSGFWHFGQNAFTERDSARIYYSRVGGQIAKYEDGKPVGGYGGFGYSFNMGVGVDVDYTKTYWNGRTEQKYKGYYNFGHFSSLNYENNKYTDIYSGSQYTSMANSGKLHAGAARVFSQSLNLLNQGWESGGVYNRMYNSNDRGQRLYKKIKDKETNKEEWVLMYIAVGTKPTNEVFQEYKDAYRIVNDRDTTETTLPAWYYFCSWYVKEMQLKLIPVDEETGEAISGVSWSGATWQDLAQENTSASVTAGTNAQYKFVCFKLEGTDNCYTNTESGGGRVSGRTFTIDHIGANQTVYAVYRTISLTAKAVDERGNSLRDVIQNVSSDSVVADSLASVTRRVDDRYVFLGFKKVDSCNGASSCSEIVNSDWVAADSSMPYYVSGPTDNENLRGITFNVNRLTRSEVVYAVYEEKSSFLGQILINGNVVVSQDPESADHYARKSEKQTFNIEDCSPVTGCVVTFTHNMKRTSGNKTVNYTISRTSNYWNNGLGVEPKVLKTETENFNNVSNGTGKQLYNDPGLKLFPGQVVCETMSFMPFVWKDDTMVLEACASALGDAQPEDPTTPGDPDTPWDDPDGDNLNGAAAFLKIEVKNENVSRYNTYRKIVYAKPGDRVKFYTTYNPVLQYTAYLKPQQMKINSGRGIYPASWINSDTYLKDLFNANKGSSLKDWNNAFYVSGISDELFRNNCDNGRECRYAVGKFNKQTIESNSFTIQVRNVGRELKETARTNQSDNVKTTPGQVSFTSNGNEKINLGNVITAGKTSEAMVRVPYNYDNDICVKKNKSSAECTTGDEELGVFAAGESVSGAYDIKINPKENRETSGDGGPYATVVPDAKSKIIIYKGSAKGGSDISSDNICSAKYGQPEDGVNCWYSEENTYSGNNSLNAEGLLAGKTVSKEFSLNIPDANAGTSYCIAAAVYPASSAEVNAANYAASSTGWMKKEGNGMWRVSRSVCFTVGKRPTFQVWGGSLYGGKDITVSSTAKNNLTLSSGNVKVDGGVLVFSSWVEQTVVAGGKVDKLASGAASGLATNQAGGGSLESPEKFCTYRVPLSIANYGNGICPSSQLTGDSGIMAGEKMAFVEIANEEKNGDVDRITNQNVIPYTIINKGVTRIVEYEGNITITGDIKYNDNDSFENLNEIPKMVIYAKQNIYINCGVKRVDAILLADGAVYTCGTYRSNGKVSDEAEIRTRTNQVQVNGAIFTKNLELGRTYGMAAGTYSKIPAEIINYDTSIILWAKGKTDKDDFDKLHQVYINELAPRY